jgi:hypothetical protein
VQQREHRTWRICGKGGGRHEADTAKQGLAGGGNFVKKKVAGGSWVCDKNISEFAEYIFLRYNLLVCKLTDKGDHHDRERRETLGAEEVVV